MERNSVFMEHNEIIAFLELWNRCNIHHLYKNRCEMTWKKMVKPFSFNASLIDSSDNKIAWARIPVSEIHSWLVLLLLNFQEN